MTGNIVLASVTILFSIFFLIFSLQLPPSPNPITLGPGFWPTTILVMMLIMGVALFVRTWLEQAKVKANKVSKEEKSIIEQSEEVEEEFSSEIVHKTRYLQIFSILIISLLLMKYLGYIITTILFIIAIAYIIGIKKWINVIITSVIGTAALTYLFAILLNITLPRGIGIFRSFTSLFY